MKRIKWNSDEGRKIEELIRLTVEMHSENLSEAFRIVSKQTGLKYKTVATRYYTIRGNSRVLFSLHDCKENKTYYNTKVCNGKSKGNFKLYHDKDTTELRTKKILQVFN